MTVKIENKLAKGEQGFYLVSCSTPPCKPSNAMGDKEYSILKEARGVAENHDKMEHEGKGQVSVRGTSVEIPDQESRLRSWREDEQLSEKENRLGSGYERTETSWLKRPQRKRR